MTQHAGRFPFLSSTALPLAKGCDSACRLPAELLGRSPSKALSSRLPAVGVATCMHWLRTSELLTLAVGVGVGWTWLCEAFAMRYSGLNRRHLCQRGSLFADRSRGDVQS